MARFTERVAALPRLGVGISTEYGAAEAGIDPVAYRDEHGGIDFLELGVDLARGLDAASQRWVERGWPTTWHFLDVNLEEPEDVDPDWLRDTAAGVRAANAAWICGDAGLWHVGPRDRGHGTLLPPVHCWTSVHAMADAVRRIREATGREVLPENPPAHVLVGDLHPLEVFGGLAEAADCGLLLDLAHLVIVQRALRLAPTTLLDAFPLERVVELHVAGGTPFRFGPHELVDDDHGPVVQEATWELLAHVAPRCTALRAVVVECERNTPDEIHALFARTRALIGEAPGLRAPPVEPPTARLLPPDGVDTRRIQRTLFRMMLSPRFADRVRTEGTGLPAREDAWLRALDPLLVSADAGNRRRDQLLGNVALEFLRTVRAAPPFHEDFVGSDEMHTALAEDRPLSLAFAAYGARVLPEGPWRAILTLDTALAEARRGERPLADHAGLQLAPRAQVVVVPEGTLAAAQALQLDEAAGSIGPGTEGVLVVARPAGPHQEADVHVEVLPDAITELLGALPLDAAALRAFGVRHDASPTEVAELVAGLRSDGVLVGPPVENSFA
jgi:uncharacterized protein (UPF0276 family)